MFRACDLLRLSYTNTSYWPLSELLANQVHPPLVDSQRGQALRRALSSSRSLVVLSSSLFSATTHHPCLSTCSLYVGNKWVRSREFAPCLVCQSVLGQDIKNKTAGLATNILQFARNICITRECSAVCGCVVIK